MNQNFPVKLQQFLPGCYRNTRSCVILMYMCFLLTNSGRFLLSAAFSWSNWEQYLLELIVWFSEGVHNRGLPSNPTIYTTSLSLNRDLSLVLLVVVHFTWPTIFSILHYCTVSTFHHLSQFVLKMEDITFKWRITCRNTVKKVVFFFFFLTLWNPNLKATNISNLVHRIFNPWFGYFEYVSNRLHDITIN